MTTVLDSLNAGLHGILAADERVHLLGEDVLDPYGGAFKVTKGLSTAFPDRVHTTPVSEAGIVGIATGMALRGLRPIVEIMFGDFTTLVVDQVVNHAAKFRSMYNDQVRVPLVIRTPMGGRRGYGATHSQSLEKLFLGVPGLRVLAPTAMADPGRLLTDAVLGTEDPVLFVEHKVLYLSPLWDAATSADFAATTSAAGTSTLRLRGAGTPALTIAAYGHMAELARTAVERLAYDLEVFAELVVPQQLSPVDDVPLLESVGRTGRLLVAEEGTLSSGWGAELVARVAEGLGPRLGAVRRVAALEQAIPASGQLEDAVLPSPDDVVKAAQELLST